MHDPANREADGMIRVVGPGVNKQINFNGRLIFGLVMVVVGVLFALDNLGIMDAGEILRFWPVALIAYGMMRVLGIGSAKRTTSGLVISAIGIWLLLDSLDLIQASMWQLFWPLILIVIGSAMVRRGLRPVGADAGASESAPMLSSFALWAGIERKVVSQQFQGGDLTAIMGGHEIDLRGAKPAGDTAVLDLLVLMGGVDLRVPENWRVTTESMVIMGGVEDKTKPVPDAPYHLILRGIVMMGGVDIKN
jgi:predicted membrane protein